MKWISDLTAILKKIANFFMLYSRIGSNNGDKNNSPKLGILVNWYCYRLFSEIGSKIGSQKSFTNTRQSNIGI